MDIVRTKRDSSLHAYKRRVSISETECTQQKSITIDKYCCMILNVKYRWHISTFRQDLDPASQGETKRTKKRCVMKATRIKLTRNVIQVPKLSEKQYN